MKQLKLILIIATIFTLMTCQSYEPFSSRKEKKTVVNSIKNKLALSNDYYQSIKDEDSLIFEVGASLDESVKPDLVKRRLDSLVAGNYSKKEFVMSLKIDRVTQGWDFEFDRSGNTDHYLKLDNVEDIPKVLNKVEGMLNSKKVETLIDSTRIKK